MCKKRLNVDQSIILHLTSPSHLPRCKPPGIPKAVAATGKENQASISLRTPPSSSAALRLELLYFVVVAGAAKTAAKTCDQAMPLRCIASAHLST